MRIESFGEREVQWTFVVAEDSTDMVKTIFDIAEFKGADQWRQSMDRAPSTESNHEEEEQDQEQEDTEDVEEEEKVVVERPKQLFQLHGRVEGRWDRQPEFYPGRITKCQFRPNRSASGGAWEYSILYDDGYTEDRVLEKYIRLERPKQLFQLRSRVEGRWDRQPEFYPGRITKCQFRPNRSASGGAWEYSILYDDGYSENRVRDEYIRRPKNYIRIPGLLLHAKSSSTASTSDSDSPPGSHVPASISSSSSSSSSSEDPPSSILQTLATMSCTETSAPVLCDASSPNADMSTAQIEERADDASSNFGWSTVKNGNGAQTKITSFAP